MVAWSGHQCIDFLSQLCSLLATGRMQSSWRLPSVSPAASKSRPLSLRLKHASGHFPRHALFPPWKRAFMNDPSQHRAASVGCTHGHLNKKQKPPRQIQTPGCLHQTGLPNNWSNRHWQCSSTVKGGPRVFLPTRRYCLQTPERMLCLEPNLAKIFSLTGMSSNVRISPRGSVTALRIIASTGFS